MNRSDIGRYDPFKVLYNLFSCNPPTIARKNVFESLVYGFGRYAAYRAVLPVILGNIGFFSTSIPCSSYPNTSS